MADLDLVLPCYNPASFWANHIITAVQCIHELLNGEIALRVIVVNDGSSTPMNEADLILLREQLPADFLYLYYPHNRGKGYALRYGVAQSNAPISIYTDIDFPYNEHDLVQLYRLLAAQKADIVAGIKNKNYYAQVPRLRIFISRFLRWLIRVFLNISVTDTQCGLKGFNQKGRTIFLKTTIDRYLFDLEFIYLADHHSDIQLMALPVGLKENIVFSKMKLQILRQEGYNFFKIWLKSLKGQ